MKRLFSAFIVASVSLLMSCDAISPVEDNVATKEQVRTVLEKDLLIFNSHLLPNQVYESLLPYKAIIIGEFHTIREEREFAASLTIRLNEIKGYTEICAECPDAYSWIFEKYSSGELEKLPVGISYNKVMPILDSLISYNIKYNKHAKLKCIDANMQSSFFLNSILAYSEYLMDSTELKIVYDSLVNKSLTIYKKKLNQYYNSLLNSPNDLGFSSESEDTKLLTDMFANELSSVEIREKWDSDYSISFNNRETLIKANAEKHMSGNTSTTIFYFGINHAQKQRFMGSNIEWLGDYLHNKSENAAGKTISIVGVPLKGEISNSNGQGTFNFDIVLQSKPNDLFKLIGEKANGNYSWIFLTDNLFFNYNVLAKYIYDEYEITAPLGLQFDAFFIFPNGSYDGW